MKWPIGSVYRPISTPDFGFHRDSWDEIEFFTPDAKWKIEAWDRDGLVSLAEMVNEVLEYQSSSGTPKTPMTKKLLPHRFFWYSPIPRWIGQRVIGRPFAAWTFGFWTFFPAGATHKTEQIIEHEYEHVRQFAIGWMAGIGLWFATLPGFGWLLLTPFTFTFVYGVASLVAWARGGHAYRDNIFERWAREAAGEP